MLLRPSRHAFAIAMLAAVCVAGCGPTEPQRQAVRGSVSLDGEPLDNVSIVFVPLGGGRGASCIAHTGQFAIDAAHGPTAGKHAVTVAVVQPDLEEFEQIRRAGGKPLESSVIPTRYQSAGALEVVIEADGETVLDLDLEK